VPPRGRPTAVDTMVRAPYGATPVPISNRDVLLAALKEGLRVDGRAAYDVRQWRFEFGTARGHVEVSLGKTKYTDKPAKGCWRRSRRLTCGS